MCPARSRSPEPIEDLRITGVPLRLPPLKMKFYVDGPEPAVLPSQALIASGHLTRFVLKETQRHLRVRREGQRVPKPGVTPNRCTTLSFPKWYDPMTSPYKSYSFPVIVRPSSQWPPGTEGPPSPS